MARSLSLVAASFVFLKGDMCPGPGVTDADAVITSADIIPDTVRLAPGASASVFARPYDKDRRIINGRDITWQTSSPAVATVAARDRYEAVVTAAGPGTASISATIGGQVATTRVIVATPTIPVAKLTLSAGFASNMHVLDTTTATAGLQDAAGNILSGRVVTFTSSDPSVAEVVATAGGTATIVARKIGTTTLTATSEGITQSAPVMVTQGPRPARITASVDTARATVGGETTISFKVYDNAGGELPDSAIAVSAQVPTVARFVGGATDVATTSRTPVRVVGVAVGTGRVIARAGTATVGVPVVVAAPAPPVAAKVSISPRSARLLAGTTQAFSATATTAAGAAYDGAIAFRAVGSGASITSGGLLSATVPGIVLVIASADAAADTAQVVVFGVDSVRVAPRGPLALAVGATASLGATVYGGGQALTGQTVAWSTTNATVLGVTPGAGTSAVLAAKAAGVSSVVATAGGKSDTVAVTVAAAPTATNSLDIHPLGVFTIKRLADGTTATFANLMIAGDHEANGDKSLQAFASYLFTALPAGANVTAATLTVRLDPQVTGAPFSLGALVVEPSTGSTLNEGALSTSAIPLATSITPGTVTVNVLPLVRAALAAGQPSLTVRFRFTQLTNGNGQIDYLNFFADPLTLTYAAGGSVRVSTGR